MPDRYGAASCRATSAHAAEGSFTDGESRFQLGSLYALLADSETTVSDSVKSMTSSVTSGTWPGFPALAARVRSAGSRTMLDVLLRRGGGAAGTPGASGVEVTCHLRGSMPSLPAKFTYGVLQIRDHVATWHRYLRRSDVRRRPPVDRVIEVRPPGGRGEWNLKRRPFRIISASGPSGTVELAVPRADVARVRAALSLNSTLGET
jgi:hypothetical protein